MIVLSIYFKGGGSSVTRHQDIDSAVMYLKKFPNIAEGFTIRKDKRCM